MLDVSSDMPTITTMTQKPAKMLKKRVFKVLGGHFGRQRVDVTDAPHAFDALGSLRQRSDLFSQIAHVCVDAAIERRELATEHIAGECLATDNLSGGLQQHFQQIKLN